MATVETIEAETHEYTKSLVARTRSFHSDPLHSAAYLGNLAQFLQRPHHKSARNDRSPVSRDHKTNRATKDEDPPFVHEYAIPFDGTQPRLTKFNDVATYKQTISNRAHNSDVNEIVFLAGRPSAEWLCAIGVRYTLDHRFFHQHLNFLPTGKRDWFTAPTLPSRSRNVLRLCIPSILFSGEHRYKSLDGLQKARGDCERQLRQRFREFQEDTSTAAGQSIVRRMNIHSGDGFVIEQELSACPLKRGDNWTVLVWTDSGEDRDFGFIPGANTDQLKGAVDRLDFCPVFFEKDLSEKPATPPLAGTGSQTPRVNQPLSSLPGNYGHTINWKRAAVDPMSTLQELFTFHAASEVQYLNMLEQFITEQITHAESMSGETEIGSILHFDYAKSILVRHDAHIQSILCSLQSDLQGWKEAAPQIQTPDGDLLSTLQTNLGYLSTRIHSIIKLCEAGRSTIMSNTSIEENKRSNEQAALVADLTKATNRLTFIFLPISFVTSVFGMNFRQFGQGNLSIWLWVAITLPLLALCIILVERGGYLKKSLGKVPKTLKENFDKFACW